MLLSQHVHGFTLFVIILYVREMLLTHAYYISVMLPIIEISESTTQILSYKEVQIVCTAFWPAFYFNCYIVPQSKM